MFLHRLFNKHKWKTTETIHIEGRENTGLEASGTLAVMEMAKIIKGFTRVVQECEICGDVRTVELD